METFGDFGKLSIQISDIWRSGNRGRTALPGIREPSMLHQSNE
jgi:hypothetical protein